MFLEWSTFIPKVTVWEWEYGSWATVWRGESGKDGWWQPPLVVCCPHNRLNWATFKYQILLTELHDWATLHKPGGLPTWAFSLGSSLWHHFLRSLTNWPCSLTLPSTPTLLARHLSIQRPRNSLGSVFKSWPLFDSLICLSSLFSHLVLLLQRTTCIKLLSNQLTTTNS